MVLVEDIESDNWRWGEDNLPKSLDNHTKEIEGFWETRIRGGGNSNLCSNRDR